MTKEELDTSVEEYLDDTRAIVTLIMEALPKGQRNKLRKNELIAALLERLGINDE